jgi:hypothetical protein
MTLDLPDAPNPVTRPVETPSLFPEAIEETATAPESPTSEVQAESSAAAETQPGEESETQHDLPELELLDQLWTAYRAQLEASIEQQSAAIASEKARLEYERAQEKTEVRRQEVKSLLESFCERLAAIRDPQSAALVAQVQSSMQDQPGSETSEASGSSDTSGSIEVSDWHQWCKIPTSQIIDGIPGLGDKKATFLVDEFPTIGDLEAARVEADKSHRHFCKVLGKGFGEKTGDAILDAMQKLLKVVPTPGSKEPASATQEPTVPAPASKAVKKITDKKTESEATADVEPESTENVPIEDSEILSMDNESGELGELDEFDDGNVYEDVDGDDADDIYAESDDSGRDDSEPEDEIESSEDEESWADTFYAKILKDPKEAKTGWGDSDKKHSEAWTKGNKMQEEWPVSACPYDESTELDEAIEWVRGWTAAEMMAMDI